MRTLDRNKQKLYYALQNNITPVTDDDELFTGQYDENYGEPVEVWMNISPARGQAILEQFGIQEQYDKVLVTDDMNCPIAEDSILWIDREPTTGGETPTQNPHDYYVVRVAKSLNVIAIAVRNV